MQGGIYVLEPIQEWVLGHVAGSQGLRREEQWLQSGDGSKLSAQFSCMFNPIQVLSSLRQNLLICEKITGCCNH